MRHKRTWFTLWLLQTLFFDTLDKARHEKARHSWDVAVGGDAWNLLVGLTMWCVIGAGLG